MCGLPRSEVQGGDDDVDALLSQFNLEEQAKSAAQIRENADPPSARTYASFIPHPTTVSLSLRSVMLLHGMLLSAMISLTLIRSAACSHDSAPAACVQESYYQPSVVHSQMACHQPTCAVMCLCTESSNLFLPLFRVTSSCLAVSTLMARQTNNTHLLIYTSTTQRRINGPG